MKRKRGHTCLSFIEHIPKTYPGKCASRVFNSPYRENATMFNFINIFTEYAKDQPIHQRLEIEEWAGLLADRIVKNKRKFTYAGNMNSSWVSDTPSSCPMGTSENSPAIHCRDKEGKCPKSHRDGRFFLCQRE